MYETSTETLFIGRQDAMQRLSLPAITRFAKERGSSSGAGLAALEVGCGTGRFMTFVRDNLPEMDVTYSDLSPFYLEKARENNKYW